MISLQLPDGSTRHLQSGSTGLDLAKDVGPGLAKAAIAIRLDGKLEDLDYPLADGAEVHIVTQKDEEDALELIRHDAAHILAMAAKELYPHIQVTIGPTVKDGFYYDFHCEEPLTPEHLEAIEQRMHEIVDRDVSTRREIWKREDAERYFADQGELFKAEIVRDLPSGEDIRLYFHGDSWSDLCRGPHLLSSSQIGHAFKLMKVAGAYWRGNPENPQLQRVYGTAWRTEKELKAYLHRLEEAEKRDHRRLGREMDLFHLQEEAPGMVFWHPHGWMVYRTLEAYMRRRLDDAGYVEVKTPQVVDRKLWEESGHWDKFRENMFITEIDEEHAREKRVNALKPMNCPCHVQIYRQGLTSYRDLPLRMAEFGSCHRYEPSGAMHGIMRVRGFTQDDAHIFCTEEQIALETKIFIDLLSSVYRDLGFESFRVKFSDRPEVRSGTDAVWDRAESALLEATKLAGFEPELNPGEGAFYGPKLEFVLTDAIGRDWQCGTLQVDFVLPERLSATYIGEDGERHHPVMLHRAILGSFERFIGILIENYAGRFPLWLAPVQVQVATVVSDADDYAGELVTDLKQHSIRASLDQRNETIMYKIREHSRAKVPVIVVVGKKEAADQTVSIRRLGSKDSTTMSRTDFLTMMHSESLAPDVQS
ncbi:MAG: threonine--tRNA ligase [Alphaproteobacteria bacterium]|nr:threonine--tRNA ligase [Alphaproteobacteria bacterium]